MRSPSPSSILVLIAQTDGETHNPVPTPVWEMKLCLRGPKVPERRFQFGRRGDARYGRRPSIRRPSNQELGEADNL